MKRIIITIMTIGVLLFSRNANAFPILPSNPAFMPIWQGATNYVSVPGSWTATIDWEVYAPHTASYIGTSSNYAYYYMIKNTTGLGGSGSITGFNLGNPLSMPIYSNSWLDPSIGITPSASLISTGQISWTFGGTDGLIDPLDISDMLYIESTQPDLVNGVLLGNDGNNASYEIPGPAGSGGGTNPVPEPVTMSLLGIGLAGLFLRRKKQVGQ